MIEEAPLTYDQEELESSKPFPTGEYSAKLIDVQVSESPIGTSLLAILTITDGPRADEDIRIYRNLKPYPGKTPGTWFVPGLKEVFADLKAVDGIAPGEKLTRDPAQARVQYAKGLAKKHLRVLVYDEDYKDKKTGETKTAKSKKRIIGLVGGSVAKTADLGLA